MQFNIINILCWQMQPYNMSDERQTFAQPHSDEPQTIAHVNLCICRSSDCSIVMNPWFSVPTFRLRFPTFCSRSHCSWFLLQQGHVMPACCGDATNIPLMQSKAKRKRRSILTSSVSCCIIMTVLKTLGLPQWSTSTWCLMMAPLGSGCFGMWYHGVSGLHYWFRWQLQLVEIPKQHAAS